MKAYKYNDINSLPIVFDLNYFGDHYTPEATVNNNEIFMNSLGGKCACIYCVSSHGLYKILIIYRRACTCI